MVNKDGKLVLNEDSSAVVFDNNAREGLKKLAAAYEDRELTLPNAASADEDTAVTAFRDGKTLFMRNWPVAYDKLRTSSGNAVERARRRPVTPNYIAFSSEFRQGVLRALRNGGEFEPDFPQRLAASVKE